MTSEKNRKKKVLIAEDSPMDATLLSSVLKKKDLETVTFEDGEQAWEHLNTCDSNDYAAVFVDLLMPKIDGLGLMKLIREDHRFQQLPLIVTTSHTEKDFVLKVLKYKVLGYIVKPVSAEKLEKVLQQIQSDKQKMDFEKGQVIFKPGDKSLHTYIIKSGHVGIFKTLEDNSEIPVAIINPNEFVGELSLISDTPRTSTARALSNVELIPYSRGDFETMLQSTATPITALITDLVHRIEKMNQLLKTHQISDKNLVEQINHIQNHS